MSTQHNAEQAETQAERDARFARERGVERMYQTSAGEYAHAFTDCRHMNRSDQNTIKHWTPSAGLFAFRDFCGECAERLKAGDRPDADGNGTVEDPLAEPTNRLPALRENLADETLLNLADIDRLTYVDGGDVTHITDTCGQLRAGNANGFSVPKNAPRDHEDVADRRLCYLCRKNIPLPGDAVEQLTGGDVEVELR